MNSIQEINRINQRELDLGLSGNASWHHQYKDSAYVHVGGLSFEMTEGDVIAVFSQFGEIMDINMPRDKETAKPRGFAFLMYEDQRSTVLAVDNMNGAMVLGRMLKVDHVHKYEQPGKRDEDGKYQKPEEPTYNAMPPELSGSESSSESDSDPADDLDAEDPMAAYLRQQKKKIKGKSKDKAGEKEEKRRRKEERRRKREEREVRRAKKGGEVKKERKEEEDTGKRINGREGRSREGEERDGRTRDRDRSESPYSRHRRLNREAEERRKEYPEDSRREMGERTLSRSRPREDEGVRRGNGLGEHDERDRRRGYDDPPQRDFRDDDRRRDYDDDRRRGYDRRDRDRR